jgi:hypothetical protein
VSKKDYLLLASNLGWCLWSTGVLQSDDLEAVAPKCSPERLTCLPTLSYGELSGIVHTKTTLAVYVARHDRRPNTLRMALDFISIVKRTCPT